MPYKISNYSKNRAKTLGVTIKPSIRTGKKIDVFRNGKKVASIGAQGYGDYPTFLAMEKSGKLPKGYAASRRKNYKIRHRQNRKIVGSPGYYADQILW